MKTIKIVLLSAAFAVASLASAQNSKADKKFNNYQYSEAIPLYKQLISKDSSNLLAWERLADCYRLTNQVVEAENCYSKIAGRAECPAVVKFYYAQMLLSNGNLNRAKFWFKEYTLDDQTDNRASNFLGTFDKWNELVSDSDRYTVTRININSTDADYGAIPYKDGIIFSSSRLTKSADMKRDDWTGNRFMSIYFAKGSSDRFSEPELFAKPVQTRFNNGPICFNSNETEMYFTKNNDDQITESNVQIDKLKIFSIVLDNGKFGVPKPFAYNNNDYSCAHPVLSPDGSHLYFSSDMPGGYGGMDLWVCEKVTEGWGPPQNLGPKINTKGNEIFPTINNDGKLYYSSNGLGGLGGLDIFWTTYADGSYTSPVNAGAPLNSSDDDFSLYYDKNTRGGYFSSNRKHQGYNDDIFAFSSNELQLSGVIIDKLTNQPLANSTIKIIYNGRQFDQLKTDNNGNFRTYVIPNRDYQIIAENMKHLNDTTLLHADKSSVTDGMINLKMSLNNKLEVDDRFVMKNILYDFNKANIREDAARELDRVISVLKDNPKVRIELSSHTDCRAGDHYNMALSEKRAKAAVKYLVMNGISKKRVIAKGYGKTQLLKKCDCGPEGGIPCTEEDHQLNRRTEIKVIE